jgi:hypothetical protein
MNSSAEVNMTTIPIWLEIKVLHGYTNDLRQIIWKHKISCVFKKQKSFYKTNNKRNIFSETYFKIKKK